MPCITTILTDNYWKASENSQWWPVYFSSCGHLRHSFRTMGKRNIEESRSCARTRTSYTQRASGCGQKWPGKTKPRSICQYNPCCIVSFHRYVNIYCCFFYRLRSLVSINSEQVHNQIVNVPFSYLTLYQKYSVISICFIQSLLRTAETHVSGSF